MQLPGAWTRRGSLALRVGRPLPRGEAAIGMMLVAPSEQHAGLRERDLHHVLGEVAGRVAHVLPRGGDAAERGVVVGAEVRADDAAVAGGDERAQRRRSVGRGSTAASRSSARA